MNRQERLNAFVQEKIEGAGKHVNDDLTDDTSLLKSGLLDSLSLLELSIWIEEEIESPLDLSNIALPDEWDTMAAILSYIDKGNGNGQN